MTFVSYLVLLDLQTREWLGNTLSVFITSTIQLLTCLLEKQRTLEA